MDKHDGNDIDLITEIDKKCTLKIVCVQKYHLKAFLKMSNEINIDKNELKKYLKTTKLSRYISTLSKYWIYTSNSLNYNNNNTNNFLLSL